MIVQRIIASFYSFRQTGRLLDLKTALRDASNSNLGKVHNLVQELIAQANLDDHERDVVLNLASQIDTR